jgi:hypothetical protein
MKNYLKIYMILCSSIFGISYAQAQNQLIIQNANVVMTGNNLVLNNTKLINNSSISTFQSGSGTVIVTGDAIAAQSELGGTSQTTFYNLEINKTTNGVSLTKEATITNQLTLTNGNIDLQSNNLNISSGGIISGGSSSSYIKTSSTGVLVREVGASNIVFPIGNSSYTPVTLNNAGTADNFNVRAENVVHQNGTSGNAITTDVVNATWYIDEAIANSSNVTATFQWNASDELTNFDRTQAFVSNYHTSKWNNGTTFAASGNNPYTLTQSGITSFSPFIIASDAAALPVELLYFYAKKEGENIRLDWQTATEINNSHFDVEWSKDGVSFEKIGEVAGAGTTNEVQFYDYIDDLNRVGFENRHSLHYYRLKQLDLPAGQAGFDEKFEYTNILSIEFHKLQIDYRIYPNPASNFITIENVVQEELIQIFSANGQLVEEHQAPINNRSISHLPKGTYFVKIGATVKRILIQ